MLYKYSVYYKFSRGVPPPMAKMSPKTSDDIAYALFHFKDDVLHNLRCCTNKSARVDIAPPLDGNIPAAIQITDEQAKFDAAVVSRCKELGLPGDEITITIDTTAEQDEVESAVSGARDSLGLCTRRLAD